MLCRLVPVLCPTSVRHRIFGQICRADSQPPVDNGMYRHEEHRIPRPLGRGSTVPGPHAPSHGRQRSAVAGPGSHGGHLAAGAADTALRASRQDSHAYSQRLRECPVGVDSDQARSGPVRVGGGDRRCSGRSPPARARVVGHGHCSCLRPASRGGRGCSVRQIAVHHPPCRSPRHRSCASSHRRGRCRQASAVCHSRPHHRQGGCMTAVEPPGRTLATPAPRYLLP